ncbi:MAG: acetyl esterase [Streptomyces sp.]|nr:acetyl esterase [Streptomyces sp.]
MPVPAKYAIDPELAGIPDFPPLDITELPAARTALAQVRAQLPVPDTTGLTITDHTVPGPTGAPGVLLRSYRPDPPAASAGILDVHGGGFMLGDLDVSHAANVALARAVGAVVVAVDYRLAPEHPYPAGLADCYAALSWFAAHAGEFGVDPERIAIHGGSAGAGLCAALALLARDRGGPSIAFQYLGVPELDDRLTTPSMTAFTDTPTWTRPDAARSWDAYLGPGRRGTDDVPPYAAPARAADLSGLPPAYISVKEFDPMRDEGIAYATGLLAAGVPVELHVFPGTFHGSAVMAEAGVSQREAAERIAVLRKALGG